MNKKSVQTLQPNNTAAFAVREIVLEYEPLDKDTQADVTIGMSDNGLQLGIHTQAPICLHALRVECDYTTPDVACVFANGFQSWTVTREYRTNEKMYAPTALMRAILYGKLGVKLGLSGAGDYKICKFKPRKGFFYGFSYGYTRIDNRVDLVGSLSERNGYTIVQYDVPARKLILSFDVEGMHVQQSEDALWRVARFTGEYDSVFDAYFQAMGIEPQDVPRLRGYTTWYNYYQNISQSQIHRDLDALASVSYKTDIFQIDDGYQTAIGDWLTPRTDTFPDGMKALAERIHSKGMLAGLWLAPFACTAKSRVFREHPEWLVRDNGNLYYAGANWGGFYALDTELPEVREHIRHFFDVILHDWSYDLVKLDFLYAVATVPRNGKPRGRIMCEAMDFLRECCADKRILGCGVPLMPAFGKVDYCRIGADMSLNWSVNRWDSREGVSTPHTLCDTIYRRHLDRRAFGNDPDVFLLRDNNIRIPLEKRARIAQINSMFGRVLFISDNVADYSDEQMRMLMQTFESEPCRDVSVRQIAPYKLSIDYTQGGKRQNLSINLRNGNLT